jgi:hypothetical protein
MLRLRQASATTVHRIERALQRQPRANKNLGSRSVNSTTHHPNTSPTRGPASPRLVSRRRFSRPPSACCWRVSLRVRPATASSPVALVLKRRERDPERCGCVREPGIVIVTGFRWKRHRIKVGHSGRSAISLPAGRYHAVDRTPRLGWKLGQCYADSPSPPAWIDVAAGSTTPITVDCHAHYQLHMTGTCFS